MPTMADPLRTRFSLLIRHTLRKARGNPDSRATNEEEQAIRQSGAFDAQWYREKYPDVAASGMDPLRHYIRYGAAEHRNPSASFDTKFYLDHYPEVAVSGMNPLLHYVQYGRDENRKAVPDAGKTMPAPTAVAMPDADVVATSGIFDSNWYLETYPTVGSTGTEPIEHYLKYGSKEGKRPNPWFDPKYYLKNNPDVAAAKVEPFLHFIKYGRKELRSPSASFNAAWYWLVKLAGEDPAAHPLAHYGTLESEAEGDIRPEGVLAPEDKAYARTIAQEILASEDLAVATAERLGHALSRLGLLPEAEKAFSRVLNERWEDPQAHARVARLLTAQKKWWQAADTWAEAVRQDATHGVWFFHLGEAHERMGRFEQAAAAYGQALELEPNHSKWHYLQGYMWEKAGRKKKARAAYAEAISRDAREDVKSFGIGAFHQARGYWPEAAEAYASSLAAAPLHADLHYKLGMAHDRCYRWKEAEACYRNAIVLNPDEPYWHYRLGFVLERQRRFPEAAEAYRAAAALNVNLKPYWWYRCGYALAAAGRYEDACLAYINTRIAQTVSGERYTPTVVEADDGGFVADPGFVGAAWASTGYNLRVTRDAPVQVSAQYGRQDYPPGYMDRFPDKATLVRQVVERDPSQAELHYRLGEELEKQEAWESAAEAYEGALARSNPHRPGWHYRHGFALFRAGHFAEACNAFGCTRIIQRAYGISEQPLGKAGLGVRLTTHYAEYIRTLPVREKTILYESHIGKAVSCSPLGIFVQLMKDAEFSAYTHAWVVDSESRIPSWMKDLPNVVFVERLSDLYLRYLATAKYLINNTGFPPYFIRREEQKYLATWHGTPLKTLGKQQTYKFLEHKRTQRNFLQATHIISPNPHTTNVLLDSYDLRHIMDAKLAETGYPRVDLTLNADAREQETIREQLDVSGERPVVLYAPTWRGTLETVAYDIEKAKSDLRYLAERHDCDIIFRGHHLMEKVFGADEDIGCTVVPSSIDTNALLSVVDVLITDYSSIFFDFLPTGRPVLYYIYDRESYERERGLYFSMDEMPGYKCADIDELDTALGRALHGELADSEHHMRARQAFNSHDDGHAGSRVVDFLFHDDPTHVVSTGPHAPVNVLMNGGGFKRNGITTSFLNLVNQVESEGVQVTVAVSPDGMEYDAESREQFDRLPEDVEVIPRCGIMTMTWEERWLRKHFRGGRQVFDGERLEIMRDLFDREYLRIFGRSHFDVALAFSGYDAFWAAILLLNRRGLRKAVYMHSDMYAEYVAKFPDLMRMFRLYGFADALVSVCPESNACNREKLSPWLNIPPERFVSSENMQDAERLLELAGKDIEERDRPLFDAGKIFINMGRLSVEKDHAKMIRAFSRVHQDHADTRLLILGAGPLKAALTQLIGELQLTDCVHILGFRSNPYPYLRKADCFVLSSNHEAKTMSLMEAMISGLPYVATDIAGNRDIKREYPAYFYPNSEDGLEQGMRDFLADKLPTPEFDWRTYQAEALCQFNERVLGMSALPASLPVNSQAGA